MALLGICTSVATTVIPCLACKAREELRYLRKYKTYVQEFEKGKGKLSSTMENVMIMMEEAGKRNETRVNPRVEHWINEANLILKEDTKATKCFGLCTNCCSKISRAKEMESWAKELIPNLIAEVDKFREEVAYAAGVPGMEFHSQDFMYFESRKETFEKLKKELEDDNNYTIGLFGQGGTGKSTMAREVGKHVQKSNPFDKVIFVKVSTPINEKGIREEIAMQLELQLKEENLLGHATQIWTRIDHSGRVLIILDDVWEELNLINIGIQHGIHNKGRCCILLTTRSLDVCASMTCQKTIQLDPLPTEDSLNLFLSHPMMATETDYPDDLKKVARDIVDECGGLPIMIEAVAKALKSWPPQQWQAALIALKNPMPSRHGFADEQKRKIYNSLQFSYVYLKDEEAQDLFLLCSIFPKAYEIPLELLERITIGLGHLGECDQYNIARIHALAIIIKLRNSSLLLKAGEGAVKMHDVIREMALENIGSEKIQVIRDSKTRLNENVKYSSWIINDFPICPDDSKLEVLLVLVNANGFLEIPDALFGGMKNLKVLLLYSKIEFGRTSALSLSKSVESLKHIRTLSLTNWELGDISLLMRNLQMLESLELINCSILELPDEIKKLPKLRFLCLKLCSLKRNNPFEVIARCSQLEELYYVSNDNHIHYPEASSIASFPKCQIYHIASKDIIDFPFFVFTFDSSQLDTSIKKSFKPANFQRMFSIEILKYLAAGAEILELKGDDAYGWNNLIPDIFSTEDGAMKDLITLSLKVWHKMKCLINTKHLQVKSGVTIFPKLAKLKLVEVHLQEICCGPYLDGFLKQLKKVELKSCIKLQGTLFKANLELNNLKSIEIWDCSMTCLFHPSTAQSLKQLETLKIRACSMLKYIIWDEGSSIEQKVGDNNPNPRSHDSMFPKLKLLRIGGCEELEFIFPICFCEDLPLLESVEISRCINVKYMFGQYSGGGALHQMHNLIILPSLKVMSIEHAFSFVNIYPECYLPKESAAKTSEGSKAKGKSPSHNVPSDPLCCFLPKSSKTANKEEPSTSKVLLQSDHIAPQEKYAINNTHVFFTPPLYPWKLREIKISDTSILTSLFSLSIASSMSQLEKLAISGSSTLKHIVTEEVDDHDFMNNNFIFRNLLTIEVKSCEKLEYVFPASYSRELKHLESMVISHANELKYVFGESCGDDNSTHQNQNIKIHLPALTKLGITYLPKMVSMCPEKYYVEASSLKDITLGNPQLPNESFIDLSVERHEGSQEQRSRKMPIGMKLCDFKHLRLEGLDMETIYDLERLQITSPTINSNLETLSMRGMNTSSICAGPKNHLNFKNLFKLIITRCHQMKFVLSASISRSLPRLRHLNVSRCGSLERIIEEDDDQAFFFPKLLTINVHRCDRLKCLLSVSATNCSFPQLSVLGISTAPELEQAFEWKHGATKDFDMNHVFPNLFMLFLDDLPKLHTICHGIDFGDVVWREKQNCPNIILDSTVNDTLLSRYMQWIVQSTNSDSDNLDKDEDNLSEQYLNRARELSKKFVKGNGPIAGQNNGSSNIKETTEASVESEEALKVDEVKDSEQTHKPEPFAAPSQSEPSQQTEKPTSQEGSLDEAVIKDHIMNPESTKLTPTANVVPSENEYPQDYFVRVKGKGKRITLDQPALPETEEPAYRDDEDDDLEKKMESSVGETSSNKISSMAALPARETSRALIPSISTLKKRQIATSSADERVLESTQLHLSDIHITDESARDKTNKVNQEEKCTPHVLEKLENDDLMRLFKIIEGGADDMEVQMSCASKIAANDEDDHSKVTKAFAVLEASLKMDLKEIASSEEESILGLQNALNTLSSHCSHDALKATIHSLQQEIQTILSSFKQAYTIIDTAEELEQKEKLMTGHYLQRKEAAMTLLYEIHETDNSLVVAQTREAELKEQISKLQAELYSKEKEIKECEIRLVSLQVQKEESFSDTIGFIKEFEAVKKERSQIGEDQIKARLQLENVDSKWSSFLDYLKKTSLLLEVHLKQKL